MPNRLALERSPYLLQHKDNPIDWNAWGDEAFERAAKEGKPVFLSVGYASCHWCHVMAHESFENMQLAEVLNGAFVSIKVDREERPDVDETYMTAVQLSSGRGGWPMSVFLTPDRKPFFAGTYFPLEDRRGQPGFLSIVRQIEESWKGNHEDVLAAADEFAKALTEVVSQTAPATFAKLDEAFVESSIRSIASDFDPKHGGFGDRPKFPPHGAIDLFLTYALRPETPDELRESCLTIALATLSRMCLGGIRDHVGGGFHRYSTDERWHLPHFEKMLYDNALMLGNLVHAAAIAGQLDDGLQGQYVHAAEELIAWVQAEMTSPQGTFYSAIDADSEGEEGKFYVWSFAELQELLGDRTETFATAYGALSQGNFEDEATGKTVPLNILFAKKVSEDFNNELHILREARAKRTRPETDRKAIVAWNGLMISALVDAGKIRLAERACDAILAAESLHGSLPHYLMNGEAVGDGFLDDYSAFADALFRLASTCDELGQLGADQMEALKLEKPSRDGGFWREAALRISEQMIERFFDSKIGGFFYTGESHEKLFGRTKPAFDQPVPSGNALALRCLKQMGKAELAGKSIQALLGWVQRAPHGTEYLLSAALSMVTASEARVPIFAEVEARLASDRLRADQNGIARGEVVLVIPEGLHVNSANPPARWLLPTGVSVRPLEARIGFPPATDERYFGAVSIPFEVKVPQGETGAEIEITVSYQACSESECFEPRERTFCAVVEG